MKNFEINIPVFITEKVDNTDTMFPITRNELINDISSRIERFNDSDQSLVSKKRKKPVKKEIKCIRPIPQQIGEVPVLLIQMDASTTNNYDLYVEKEQRTPIDYTDKVGSGNHWILLYPKICGLNPNDYSYFWYVFVYADPTKQCDDIINSAKMFIDKIALLKLRNIKPTTLFDELRSIRILPKVQVRCTTLTDDINGCDTNFSSYVVSGVLKKEQEHNFENMPSDKTIELINKKKSIVDSFKKLFINIDASNKKYKITRKYDECKDSFIDSIEENFNMNSNVTEQDLKDHKLFDESFIMSKLEPVVNAYLSNYAH